jgi:hypothetical protein
VKSLARRNPMVGVSILLNLGLAVLLFLILDADKDAPRIPARTVIEASEQRVTLPPPPPPLLAQRASPSPKQLIALPPLAAPADTVDPESKPSPKTIAAPSESGIPPINGRVLLRQLEAGDGPGIEIAWPASQSERNALYRVFARCYGMTTAILGDDDRIYRAKDPAGADWRLNPDRYSGFLRQASGRAVPAERRELDHIRARHRIRGGLPVRLFPRAVDSALLGGLQQTTGARFEPNAVIRARYRLSGVVVRVTDIHSGGVRAPGEFDLGPVCTD